VKEMRVNEGEEIL